MEKLIAELTRLYLAPEAITREALAQHILGKTTLAIKLTTADGLTRALAIPFRKVFGDGETGHWERLCTVANALQADLGLPVPAVSIDGANAYRLWLSLETPVPADQAQDFLELLRQAWFPALELAPDAATAPVYLPPCLNPRSGKWAAFIHPGMGASFAEESGLEMSPPLAGQAGFLEGLDSIDEEQFRQALRKLEQRRAPAPAPAPAPAEPAAAEPSGEPSSQAAAPLSQPRARTRAAAAASTPAATPDGLLLKDATLEDIVRFLHEKNIEPTFRFLPPR
jgi:pyruvate/2-oxoglutarate dehydrogenase complex dihydrolipoamide acyltransferase (E2) component